MSKQQANDEAQTKKVVINACFGGFGLSHEGVMHYAKLAGLTLYPESDGKYASLTGPTYYTAPKDERLPVLHGDEWAMASMEERRQSNENYDKNSLSPRDIARDDPHLVATVEQLGAAASGRCASLRVVEIPADVAYVIEEYDGNEHVAEAHRTWP
jgi:hypothetical protein